MTEFLPKIKKLPKREYIEVKSLSGIEHSRAGQGCIAGGQALEYSDGALGAIAPRRLLEKYNGGRGLFTLGEHFILASTEGLYCDGEYICELDGSHKRFCACGARVYILPDLVWYDTESRRHGTLRQEWQGLVGFEVRRDESCVINHSDLPFNFEHGDRVIISGCSDLPQNNKSFTVTYASGDMLTAPLGSFDEGTEYATVTVLRDAPRFENLLAISERLWGTVGDRIYASRLGCCTNFSEFGDDEEYDSDSGIWQGVSGDVGEFTAACIYDGSPVFFKRECAYTVEGRTPESFRIVRSDICGASREESDAITLHGGRLALGSFGGVTLASSSSLTPIETPSELCVGGVGLRSIGSSLYLFGESGLYCHGNGWLPITKERCAGVAELSGNIYLLLCDGSLFCIERNGESTGAGADEDTLDRSSALRLRFDCGRQVSVGCISLTMQCEDRAELVISMSRDGSASEVIAHISGAHIGEYRILTPLMRGSVIELDIEARGAYSLSRAAIEVS